MYRPDKKKLPQIIWDVDVIDRIDIDGLVGMCTVFIYSNIMEWRELNRKAT